jgi:hypothetical protein
MCGRIAGGRGPRLRSDKGQIRRNIREQAAWFS